MQALILAGGRGTRLSSILTNVPKPMADIGGRPFLEYLLDLIIKQGGTSAILSTGHFASQISQHFGRRYRSLSIQYVVEDKPLGTGGAIKRALEVATEENVLVLNGDTFAELPYRDMFEEHIARKVSLTIAVRNVEDMSRYGAIELDEESHIRVFGEKRSCGRGLINSGVYVVSRRLFDEVSLPESFSMENDFIAANLQRLQPLAYRNNGYFIDIGVPSDLERARRELPSRCPA